MVRHSPPVPGEKKDAWEGRGEWRATSQQAPAGPGGSGSDRTCCRRGCPEESSSSSSSGGGRATKQPPPSRCGADRGAEKTAACNNTQQQLCVSLCLRLSRAEWWRPPQAREHLWVSMQSPAVGAGVLPKRPPPPPGAGGAEPPNRPPAGVAGVAGVPKRPPPAGVAAGVLKRPIFKLLVRPVECRAAVVRGCRFCIMYIVCIKWFNK